MSTIASVFAALVSLLFLAATGADLHRRKKRALLVGLVTWFAILAWYLFQTFSPIDRERDPRAELQRIGLGGIASEYGQAVQIRGMDNARTYIKVRMTSPAVDRIALTYPNLEQTDFDAHLDQSKGQNVPDWWPVIACEGGYRLMGPPFPEPPLSFAVNYCPLSQEAYIRNFDY